MSSEEELDSHHFDFMNSDQYLRLFILDRSVPSASIEELKIRYEWVKEGQ